MEEYVWDSVHRSVMTALARMKSKDNIGGDLSPGEELDYLRSPEVSGYRDAVTALRNTKESHESRSLERYKAAALNLLQMSSREEAQTLRVTARFPVRDVAG
ncbi:uncharacterized protein LOC119722706 [Patiria miniata]|uniref:Uncharacterized protein n=1 Tax=Patiria miniata TaxID=46514 RepID=A0A913ZAT2_PATMI|nr:uncharacterized protein LOC119722706 [Patiria miniata]